MPKVSSLPQQSIEHALLASMCSILRSKQLVIPVRKRAKFEGWLKIRLSHYLESHHGLSVDLEVGYKAVRSPARKYYADLLVRHPDGFRAWVMLKTCNTNFRFPGIKNVIRPITQNIREIGLDVRKLRGRQTRNSGGYVCFTMYSLAVSPEQRHDQVEEYLKRIKARGCVWVDCGFHSFTVNHGIGYFLGRYR